MQKQNRNTVRNLELKSIYGVTISTIVLAELQYGISLSNRFEKNTESLYNFLTAVEILNFDIKATLEYGKIRAALRLKGTPIGPMDALIAAHAKSKNLILVTNNTREFSRVEGLQLEDWSVC
jgi:tRNA(fMet)-specific endonuclease VapC